MRSRQSLALLLQSSSRLPLTQPALCPTHFGRALPPRGKHDRWEIKIPPAQRGVEGTLCKSSRVAAAQVLTSGTLSNTVCDRFRREENMTDEEIRYLPPDLKTEPSAAELMRSEKMKPYLALVWELPQTQPRSAGGEVSPGRKPRVKWESESEPRGGRGSHFGK